MWSDFTTGGEIDPEILPQQVQFGTTDTSTLDPVGERLAWP